MLVLTLCACGGVEDPNEEPAAVLDGTWYGVSGGRTLNVYNIESGDMYLFKDGEILRGSSQVGTYEIENDKSMVVSLESEYEYLQSKPYRVYLNKSANDVDILTNTEDGEQTICFCRGADNWRDLLAIQREREQDYLDKQESLNAFESYAYELLPGKWVAEDSDDGLISFVISDDFKSIVLNTRDGYTINGLIVNRRALWSEAYENYPAVQLDVLMETDEHMLYDFVRPDESNPHYNDGLVVCGGPQRTEGGAIFIKQS